MITVVLFDMDDAPVGRANLPNGSLIPAAIVWNDRIYNYTGQTSNGYRYRQVSAVEIPPAELRRAPGLAERG
jgi:hypothetical protein